MTASTTYTLRMSRPAGFAQLGASWTTPVGVAEIAYAVASGDRDSQPEYTNSAGVGARDRN